MARVVHAVAGVDAVFLAIPVSVAVRDTAAADTGRDLAWVRAAAVGAVGGEVAVGIGLRDTAAADTGLCLVVILGASVRTPSLTRDARLGAAGASIRARSAGGVADVRASGSPALPSA
jgi:hypothetical protein